jgi:hypothetical protein
MQADTFTRGIGRMMSTLRPPTRPASARARRHLPRAFRRAGRGDLRRRLRVRHRQRRLLPDDPPFPRDRRHDRRRRRGAARRRESLGSLHAPRGAVLLARHHEGVRLARRADAPDRAGGTGRRAFHRPRRERLPARQAARFDKASPASPAPRSCPRRSRRRPTSATGWPSWRRSPRASASAAANWTTTPTISTGAACWWATRARASSWRCGCGSTPQPARPDARLVRGAAQGAEGLAVLQVAGLGAVAEFDAWRFDRAAERAAMPSKFARERG